MSSVWTILRTTDPLWVAFLQSCGGALERTDDCFVTWKAVTHTLLVANDHDLDDDDSLAQIILHELCHHLVEGTPSWTLDDWGLDNISDDDIAKEYAALRLQHALLAGTPCLDYLYPTTDHRWFFSRLTEKSDAPQHRRLPNRCESGTHRPADHIARRSLCTPVDDLTDAASIAAACAGWENWEQWPHRPALQALLTETAVRIDSFLRSR